MSIIRNLISLVRPRTVNNPSPSYWAWQSLKTALFIGIVIGATDCASDNDAVHKNPVSGGAGGTGAGGADAGQNDAGNETFGALRQAAIHSNKLLGTAINSSALNSDLTYGEVAGREFNYVTPENEMKWGLLEPTQGNYTWGNADAIVQFAEAHGQLIKGHTLVWHAQLPSWVDGSLSADQLNSAIKTHIETTLQHFRGHLRAWDVVNEAVDVSTASGYRDSVFWETLGPDYIENAFRWARAADPDVLLFYNDFGIERLGPKSDFTYAMIRDLVQKGVPIDGIGFQSHITTSRYPADSDLRANIRRFADLGLKVNISELDSHSNLVPGTQDFRWQAQRIAFQEVVGSCAVEPGCEAVTFWGFTDKFSWLNDPNNNTQGTTDVDPLIFDGNYAPKPAYDGVLSGLAGLVPMRGDNVIVNGDFASNSDGGDSWSNGGGTLTVSDAIDRNGVAACVTARTQTPDGLSQGSLLNALAAGGPYSFSAWVRLSGASSAGAAGGRCGRAAR